MVDLTSVRPAGTAGNVQLLSARAKDSTARCLVAVQGLKRAPVAQVECGSAAQVRAGLVYAYVTDPTGRRFGGIVVPTGANVSTAGVTVDVVEGIAPIIASPRPSTYIVSSGDVTSQVVLPDSSRGAAQAAQAEAEARARASAEPRESASGN
jgi:hypothetical protein